ncbi:MAG: lipopolysaccharide kinase InaA family protein [Tannerellaceae bacterium]|jgi:serine/threonine protein kinase|nr:lipopolysaccharide kinase InaA family protein [Tannerellaceae bacterium]
MSSNRIEITVNPAYRDATHFVESLPERFDACGETIYKARNEIKLMRMGAMDVAVKSFKVPHLVNRFAYAFLRPSKAARSYFNALRLMREGVLTPTPVACVEEKRYGLLHRSYYVSAYVPVSGILRDLHYCTLEQVREPAEALAHFTADIHSRRILHRDYSPGNVLYEKVDGEYRFYLLDINRMSFDREIDERTAAFVLRKMWDKTEVALFIAGIYARDRGFDEGSFRERLLKHRLKFWHKP